MSRAPVKAATVHAPGGATLRFRTRRPIWGRIRWNEPVPAAWWNALPPSRQDMFARMHIVGWVLPDGAVVALDAAGSAGTRQGALEGDGAMDAPAAPDHRSPAVPEAARDGRAMGESAARAAAVVRPPAPWETPTA